MKQKVSLLMACMLLTAFTALAGVKHEYTNSNEGMPNTATVMAGSVKDLVDGRIAVSVTNRGGSEIVVPAINLADIYLQANAIYTAREVWSKKEANIKKVLNVGTLKPYETKVYVLAVCH